MKLRRNEIERQIEREIARIEGEHRGRQTRIVLATIVALCLSVWLTAKGIFDKAVEAGVASTEGMVTAGMSALVAAVLLAVVVAALFGLAMEAGKKQRWQVVMLTIAVLPFLLGISTFSGVLGNAGPASLVFDMRDAARDHVRFYEEAASDPSQASSAAASLQPIQAPICRLANDEGERGALSGSAGKGGIYAAYSGACESVTTIIRTLEETVARSRDRRETAAKLLLALQDVPGDVSLSVFKRKKDFRTIAADLRKLVEETRAEKVADRLKAQLKVAEASVATIGLTDGRFGQKQAQSIQNLKGSLTLVSKIVTDLLDKGQKAMPEPPAPLRSTGAAVLAYWDRNIPEILIAILSDCMVLLFVAVLLVSRNSTEARVKSLKARLARLRRSSRQDIDGGS